MMCFTSAWSARTRLSVRGDAIIRARSGSRIRVGRSARSSSWVLPGSEDRARQSLAAALFDTEENMVRIDIERIPGRHTVSRLVGAPPGYIGYEEGGQLTEATAQPYSVILLRRDREAQSMFSHLLQVLGPTAG